MKKKLLLFVFVIGIISFANAQVIDLIGKGIFGESTSNLPLTNIDNITKIEVGVLVKGDRNDPLSGLNDVTFNNTLNENPTSNFDGLNYDYAPQIIDWFPIGAYSATFNTIDANGVDAYHNTDYGMSFYAYIYRNVPNASYKSFRSNTTTEVVFFYRNGTNDPYVYNIPIDAASGPRNITVKIPISEMKDDSRIAIIDITAGSETAHAEVSTYTVLGNSLFIGEYTLTNVPGDVTNVEVSIISPNPLILYPDGTREGNGDSFFVSGVVVDVDKVEEECGECEGKVTSLEMQYNGSTDATIKVLGKKEGNEIFVGDVAAGGTFNLIGFDKHGTLGTEIMLYIDGVQNTKIHTSCSKPIGPGLVSGDFEVLGGESREGGILCPVETPPDGGDCGECDGKATALEMQYNGSSSANIKVTDKKGNEIIFEGSVTAGGTFNLTGFDKHGTLGTEIVLYIDGVQNTKIHTSCSQPLGPGLISGDFEVLSGMSRNGGEMCPVDVPPTPPNGGDCGECDGKATTLTFRYDGADEAQITVTQKKDDVIVFNGLVLPGADFSVVGTDKGTLGTEIIIKVNGILNTKIHTSCSKPLYIGLVSGDFTVVDGYSKNGGQFCEGDPGEHDNDKNHECKVNIYPNPTSDYGTIRLDSYHKGRTTVKLYNNRGRLVNVLYDNKNKKGSKSREVNFSTNKYKKGTYFVIISHGNQSHKKQIVIKR